MTERMVQLPVSLIERAPHAPGCQIAGLWILPENGGRAVQQSGKCTCWKAEVPALLSEPTPLSIEDMAPGTTFHALGKGVAGIDHHFRVTGERRGDYSILYCITHEFGALSSYVDESTIHDVQEA